VNKYRNVKTTVFGQTFHSKKEAERYMVLRSMQEAGEIAGLQTQVPFELKVNGMKVCKYVADFVYTVPNPARSAGGPFVLSVVEDVKGMKTAVYNLKKKLMKAVLGVEVHEV
jgi:hypothetical protein